MKKQEIKISPSLSKLPVIDYRTLKDFQGNLKDLTDNNYSKLLKSFNEFGFIVPLFIWKKGKENFIIDAHQRIRVLTKENIQPYELPYIEIQAKDEKEAKKKLLVISSQYGKISQEGYEEFTWDIEAEWLTGTVDFDALTYEVMEPEATEDDYTIPDTIKTDIVLGDLFEIGEHRLLCADCTSANNAKKLMNGSLADLYITDPPYGVSYAAKNKFLNAISPGNRIQTEIENDQLSVHDCGKLWADAFTIAEKAMTDKASYYIFSAQGPDLMMMMMMMIDKVFALKHCLIWVKNNHVLGRSDYNYKHEPFLFGWKKNGTHNFYGGFQTSVFEFDKPLKNDLHPTMKPIALLSEFIKNSSLSNNIILDSFLGSGSTMVAAHQLNRKCYGIEISPEYCQVIVDRMLKLDPKLIVRKNGKPFESKIKP